MSIGPGQFASNQLNLWHVCSQRVNQGTENTISTFAVSTSCMMQSALLKCCELPGELVPLNTDRTLYLHFALVRFIVALHRIDVKCQLALDSS